MITVYISIGNSDDKLTQKEWHDYYVAVNITLRALANAVHGQWVSEPASAWQNACWCVVVVEHNAAGLKEELRRLASSWRQDSIAWAEAPTTEFLGSPKRQAHLAEGAGFPALDYRHGATS